MTSNLTESFLSRIELFRDLDPEECLLLQQRAEARSYEPGSLLFTEHSPRRYLFIIEYGEVELFKTTPQGEETRLSFFRAQDFLGEGALMDDYPHSTSARALLETGAFLISREAFLSMFEDNPTMARKILSRVARVVSRRIRQASTRVLDVGAQYISGRTRSEHDLLGDREVPDEFYYGVQTLRALENFHISGVTLALYPVLIGAITRVKLAAAMANADLGLLARPVADAIEQACHEVIGGKLQSHFVVDMIQGGAGTSTNMNANEVIANRALEVLGYEKGQYEFCHPNNHLNLSQSTNDVYPTSLKLALMASNKSLVEVLGRLTEAFRVKATDFSQILKMGRTQLQDAVPMTLGQSFAAWATMLEEEVERLEENARLFLEVNMGGTAIGTGINADPEYGPRVIEHLRDVSGFDVRQAPDLVEATQDTGSFVMYSSALKRLAVKLSKVCNDLRLLSSGPRTGINEINLPAMQPGSSIMPGKVNPVIPEVVNQIAFKVIGNDLTVTLAAEAGQLELNVMEPVIAQSLFESIEMLKNGMTTLQQRCVEGITANEDVCRQQVERSIGLVTALVPRLGYDTCSRLAREALEQDRGVYELVLEQELLSQGELDLLLDPENMVGPGASG